MACPALLFCLLDTDSDERMVNDVKKILISFVALLCS